MSDDLMMQIAHTLASLDRRIARLEVGEAPASSGTAGTASMTASEILTAIKTVDGASSGLDADLLDGSHAAAFSGTAHTHDAYVGTATYTAADVLAKLLTVDGTASLLDADKLDGLDSAAFSGTAHTHTAYSGTADVLRRDGSLPLTGAWDAGGYNVTIGSALIVGGTANIAGAATITGGATLGAAIDTSGTDTALVLKQGGGTILYTDRTSAESIMSIGNGRAQDGNAMIRLVGDTTYTAYGVELYRNAGANGSSAFFHRGTGDLQFNTIDAAAWKVLTNNTLRITVAANGAATFTVSIAVPTLIIGVAHTLTRSAASGAFVSTAERITLADNAELSLGMFIGTVEITDITNGNVALFAVRGGVNAVQEIYDPSGIFTGVKGSATSFNVYYEAGEYKLQNKRGASKVIATHVRTA